MIRIALLLPAMDRLASRSLITGILANWIARGDRLPNAKPGRNAAIRELFQFTGMALPVAALTRSLDASDTRGSAWLRADPAYIRADATTVRMLACGNMDLSPAENDELALSLRPLFGDAGFPLEPTTPSRWYLRCPEGAQLPDFATPDMVLGDDLAHHLPAGDLGRRWRHLLNEAQVILHNHPLNAAREQRGQLPVNSLWIWGGGKLPEWARTEYTCILSDDLVITALARLANVFVTAPNQELLNSLNTKKSGLAHTRHNDSILLDLGDQHDNLSLERDWFRPLQNALRRRRIISLHIYFYSGERMTVKPAHRWRFWRRVKPLVAR